MNTKAKGDRIEERYVAALEAMGYRCERARAVRYRFGGHSRTKVHDFFGCGDVLAAHPVKRPLLANTTTDNVSVASKAIAFEDVRPWLDGHFDLQVARWIAPDKPGEKGVFGIYRGEEAFQVRHLFTPGDACFPWEMPGC